MSLISFTSDSNATSSSLEPDPDSPGNFLSGILSAVTIAENSICYNCEEGRTAFSKCLDCSELLCDPCVRAHQRVRLTKDHRITRFPIEAKTSPLGPIGQRRPPSQMSSTSHSSMDVCGVHREPLKLYCRTCHLPACSDCMRDEHCGHQLNYIEEAIEIARSTNMRLNVEARSAIVTIREALDNVQRVSESLHRRTHQTSIEVRAFMRKFMAAVDEREHELLIRIDQARQYKVQRLMVQMENMRLALDRLSRTSDLLNESLECSNAVELYVANERASAELRQIRQIRNELLPCEDDTINFILPDLNFIRGLSSMGNIALNPPRNRLPDKPRNRPIFGAANFVLVREPGHIPSLTFGTEGVTEGQLCRPWGVCCDPMGHIIVADRSNNRIQVFNPAGEFLYKFGSQGTGPGQFDRPAGVTINPEGNIIVADKDNHRIQVFRIDGTFVLTFGEKGTRNGQFNYPWDVACNSLGHIVVTDTRNHRVQLFTSEGQYMCKYGFEGVCGMWKQFDSPRGVCFSPSGNIIVTDFNNHRLVVIDPTLSQAQFLGQEGQGFKQFYRPQGIICDDDGNIIVADSRNHRIQVFRSDGTYAFKFGHQGKGSGEMDRPSGICLNPEGRIVFVDFGNSRVQIY